VDRTRFLSTGGAPSTRQVEILERVFAPLASASRVVAAVDSDDAGAEVMEVLRWHVATQLVTPEQKASELLFPAEDGGFRSVSFVKKAFATVGRLIGLKKSFTPRGMRRTFNDLMRLARVEAVVTKSISGHVTDRMREHYSTVTPEEQRRSIRNVVNLFGDRKSGEGAPASGEGQPKAGRG
jgi:hypothetical protein